MFKTLFSLSLVAFAAAECPNACSGHGSCGNFDMCTCYRNWQAADCSQRTCPFDRAHVDTPKGDLNSDLAIKKDAGDRVVVVGSTVYPYGTTESSFTHGTTSVGHDYMECSNKGLCDRTSGTCECFDGYDGVACQRASCPNDCSGHGICQSISEIASQNFGNVYALWDKDATRGCVCDAGYDGPDCSARMCKYGIDPLYSDDVLPRTTKVSVVVKSTGSATIAANTKVAIKFYDVFGEDYTTKFISITSTGADDAAKATAVCTAITTALKELPNNSVPSVNCYGTHATASGDTTATATLDFVSNPGYLKMPEVVTTKNGVSQLGAGTTAAIHTVEIGEFVDYWATPCALSTTPKFKTTITAAAGANQEIVQNDGSTVLGADTDMKALKKCLGDSNGVASDNVGIENWDIPLGAAASSTENFIHVAKVIQTTASANSYRRIDNLLISSASMSVINLMADITQPFKIYATDGTAKKNFGWGSYCRRKYQHFHCCE